MGPTFCNSMQPNSLVVLHISHDGLQDDVLHDLLQHRGQADKSVVPWIFFLILLMDDSPHLLRSAGVDD